ncbi:unnamed protein product [Miscanthus lutarioriparius]|uniref:Bifunctional inhibitor/plant lipid transfer protein/seed storage helical domain-containing protein n=1 Tax=Miscanthus lutarioriparius TaxID=422564 RepID=A0A811M6B8_9POAL|nr:unnamed protein product [Miscanthus lutarioriparius]
MEFQAFHQSCSSAAAACDSPHGEASMNARVKNQSPPGPASPDCCGGLRQVLGKSPKCLCVLVKDKDDPNLGIKINATLALALPNACGATRANVSHCAQLLHIPPGSKDAAAFSPGGDKGSTAAPAKDNSTATTDSRALQATNGGGVSSPASATAGAALTALLAGYLLVLVPELSPSSF